MFYASDMAKIGRNDPCPCASGSKYKRCCALATTPTPPVVPVLSTADPIVDDGHCECCIDRLNDDADRALDMLLDGDLDEAERICLQLMREFPREVEGPDLLSMVYEDRGQLQRAADLQRHALDLARANPHVEPETRLVMHQRLKRLEQA